MVNFCNPLVLGTLSEFRKNFERPILNSREPSASPSVVERAAKLQRELSTIVNEFILKRGNILNAQHLPPKLVQYVCCRLSPLQEEMYDTLLSSKVIRHIRDGMQKDALNSIRYLMHICCHPQLILDSHRSKSAAKEVDEELDELVKIIHEAGGTYTLKHYTNYDSIY
jgi:DNA repair and recombination RAD54-like protein